MAFKKRCGWWKKTFSRLSAWWFVTYFLLSPRKWGKMIQSDCYSNGLVQPSFCWPGSPFPLSCVWRFWLSPASRLGVVLKETSNELGTRPHTGSLVFSWYIGKDVVTHYIRCIWGWWLRVPSRGYHPFPCDGSLLDLFAVKTTPSKESWSLFVTRISTALVPACSLPPYFSISTMVTNILWKLRSVHVSICKTGFQPRFFPLDAKCTVLSSLPKPSILDHVHHQTSLLALPLNLASFVEISVPLCAGYHQHLQQAGRRVWSFEVSVKQIMCYQVALLLMGI